MLHFLAIHAPLGVGFLRIHNLHLRPNVIAQDSPIFWFTSCHHVTAKFYNARGQAISLSLSLSLDLSSRRTCSVRDGSSTSRSVVAAHFSAAITIIIVSILFILLPLPALVPFHLLTMALYHLPPLLFFSSSTLTWQQTPGGLLLWRKKARLPELKDFGCSSSQILCNGRIKGLVRYNPPWVNARLAVMVQGQGKGQFGFSTPQISGRALKVEQLWKKFFLDPSQWWDNRLIKKSPKYPDFKHKSRHEGLWIESWQNPPWVKAKMASMALDQTQICGGLKLWNGDVVSKLCQEGKLNEALHMVEIMVQNNLQVPIDAFAGLLKVCARSKALAEGRRVHSLVVQSGRDSNIFLGSTLVDMYAKCNSVFEARQTFNTMPEHTVYSWTAVISGYADNGQAEEAINLFHQMQAAGISLDKVACVVVLKACARTASLEEGKQIHSHIINNGINLDVIVGSTLIDMYAKCGCLEDACEVFNNMNERDVVSWNAMIAGYAQQGLSKEAFALYKQMKQEGMQPDEITFGVLVKACASIAALEQGKQLHSHILRCGLESNAFVGTALVNMYAKCGHIEHARHVFNSMHEQNVVSWNAMIAGYAQQGLSKEAFALYEQMKQKNVKENGATFVVLLKACSCISALEKGKQIHFRIINSGFKSDAIVGSALVDMYAKCGRIEDARQEFNKLSIRDVVSWSVMIAGYAQQGLGREALALYEQMKEEDVQPDKVTYVALVNACSSIAALEQGKDLHSNIVRCGFDSDVIIANTLINMYAKCGCIKHARKVFTTMKERDVVSWTALISGYAQQGLGKEALTLLEQMRGKGMNPNEVTYLSVLSACSHSGLVHEGCYLFDSMCKDHDVTPTVDHYACVVDLLGRSGHLAEAEDFINTMPIQPDVVVWMALLGAARSHGNVEIGRHAFDCVLKLEPENDAAYVLLSNIYAEAAGRGLREGMR